MSDQCNFVSVTRNREIVMFIPDTRYFPDMDTGNRTGKSGKTSERLVHRLFSRAIVNTFFV